VEALPLSGSFLFVYFCSSLFFRDEKDVIGDFLPPFLFSGFYEGDISPFFFFLLMGRWCVF